MSKDTNRRTATETATLPRPEPRKTTEVFAEINTVPIGLVTALKAHIWQLLDGPDIWGEMEADVMLRLDLTDEQIARLKHYFKESLPEHSAKVTTRASGGRQESGGE